MPIQTRMIDFKSNGGTTPGYLALPEGDGKHPGIVVIQEWWGLVPHIKDVTERFAREGFVALAPDLYHGIAASEPDEAKKLAMALDRNRAVSEILAAAKYLKSLDSVSPKKVGAIGWCMGGGLALSSAAEANELATAIAFYGRPLAKEDVAKLHVPVMGLYGELDQGIPVTAVREFENELKQAGVAHEIHIYPNAPHAFFNDARPHIYKADAAQDAWQKTLGWFRKYLV